MARTKSLKDFVEHHIKGGLQIHRSPSARGIDAMLSGALDTGKTITRGYIRATVGFEKLAEATDTPPKSLIVCSAHAAPPGP